MRKWVLLRLTIQVAESAQAGEEKVRGLKGFDLDWGVVVEGLWREADDGVQASHGPASAFAKEVRAMGAEMGFVGRRATVLDLETEWARLRKVVDAGLP